MDELHVCDTEAEHRWVLQTQEWNFPNQTAVQVYVCIWCGATKEEEIHVNV